MTRPLLIILVFLTGLAGCVQGPGAVESRRPNIVIILADDMGYDSVSYNNPQIGRLSTLNIDRLASEGMNFTDAHSASSVCTPTRYGLLTGRYCWRSELQSEVLWDYGRPLIETGRLTVGQLLQQQGYTTGMIGKWHLGFEWFDEDGNLANHDNLIRDAIWREENGSAHRIRTIIDRIDYSQPLRGGPIDNGFNTFFGVDLPNFSPYAWIEQDRLTAIPSVPKPESMFGSEGPMVPGWKLQDLLPTLGERSAQWIHEQSESETPFFLYVSLTSPHTPIAPSAAFQGRSEVNAYADFVIETDAVVGRVLQALEEAGVADDTMVIFTTDNGTASAAGVGRLRELGVELQTHFRGLKGGIYDGGHRVPFIARWPGTIDPGSRCDQVIGLNDCMATFAELLGADLPDDAGEDSTSILPLLTGEQQTLADRPAVVHHSYRGEFAIRDRQWKLICSDPPQLYDMLADPKETTDVAPRHPEVVERLQDLLTQYQRSGRSTPPSR